MTLADLIRLAGFAQLFVLIASALVPLRLQWRTALASLPTLLRQLFWVYGFYVVLGIVANGLVSIVCAEELAEPTSLAHFVCGSIAVFWGLRLPLQAVFDARPFLTAWWLTAGYHLLTVLFTAFVLLYGFAALRGIWE